jgi:hypothetical protein
MTGDLMFGDCYERIGITATREGLTWAQRSKLESALRLLKDFRQAKFFHHGDCVGGDEQGALLARDLGFTVVGHPPVVTKLRAFFDSDESYEPAPYLDRDRALADTVDLLLALPKSHQPSPRSGTWFTYGYATGTGTKACLILPDGSWRP